MITLNMKKTLNTLAIAAFLTCGLAAQSAMAEIKVHTKVAAATQSDPEFAKLDTNGNGKISLKEAAKDKSLTASFDAVDANKDGNVSGDEFTAFKLASTGKIETSPAEVIEPAAN